MNHYERIIELIAEANQRRASRQLRSSNPNLWEKGREGNRRALQSQSVRRVSRALEKQRTQNPPSTA